MHRVSRIFRPPDSMLEKTIKSTSKNQNVCIWIIGFVFNNNSVFLRCLSVQRKIIGKITHLILFSALN